MPFKHALQKLYVEIKLQVQENFSCNSSLGLYLIYWLANLFLVNIKFIICISKLLQLSNYLERNLFPLRLLCYTQHELFKVPHGEKIDLSSCLRQFFLSSEQKFNKTKKCLYEEPFRILVSPRISHHLDRINVVRSAPSACDYRNYIRETEILLSSSKKINIFQMNRMKSASLRGKVSRGYPRLFLSLLLWHVPYEMYPKLCYPPFAQGSGLIVTRETAQRTVDGICSFPPFNLDHFSLPMGAVLHGTPAFLHKKALKDF
uniref:Hexosyltransferase n=1 Tax=Wuchereria bancrofti TaxID=6293 RepID=A0A1I8EPA6_WUCBA